jgi:hypothetical protein
MPLPGCPEWCDGLHDEHGLYQTHHKIFGEHEGGIVSLRWREGPAGVSPSEGRPRVVWSWPALQPAALEDLPPEGVTIDGRHEIELSGSAALALANALEADGAQSLPGSLRLAASCLE